MSDFDPKNPDQYYVDCTKNGNVVPKIYPEMLPCKNRSCGGYGGVRKKSSNGCRGYASKPWQFFSEYKVRDMTTVQYLNSKTNVDDLIAPKIESGEIRCTNHTKSISYYLCPAHRDYDEQRGFSPSGQIAQVLEQFKVGGTIMADQIRWLYQNINAEISARMQSNQYK